MNWGFGLVVSRGLLLLLASLMLLSLLSYHPLDHTLLNSGSLGGYMNWCGFVGANLAGLPVALLGLGAWLLPFYIVWEALRREEHGWQKRVAWLTLGISVWTILGAAGNIMWPPKGGFGAGTIYCGGAVGEVAWSFLGKVFGLWGLVLTLAAMLAFSSVVLAPRSTKAFAQYLARFLGRIATRVFSKPTLDMLSDGAKALLGVATKPFRRRRRVRPETVSELNTTDALALQALDRNNQLVEALNRAEREAASVRRASNVAANSEAALPTIYTVKVDDLEVPVSEPTPIRPISIVPIDPGSDLPGVVEVAPEPEKYTGYVPRPELIQDVPIPPPERSVVEPRATTDSQGRTIEQRDLGLSEPSQPPPSAEGTAAAHKRTPVEAGQGRRDQQNQRDRLDLPPRRFFNPPSAKSRIDQRELEATSDAILQKLAEFKVRGRVTGTQPGPVVTVFEFSPDPGVSIAKVMGMEEDLALGLRAEKIRIDRIAGKNVVGIEVPNATREIIGFREILDTPEFLEALGARSFLHMVLGKDMGGGPVVTDLAKMPHLLIGGSTGSGKSVGVNAMICSILMRARADEVKLILVDPKMVELGIYEDIPHLWAPVVTDMKEAGRVLKWVVAQMDDRYRRLTLLTVRNLEQFNAKVIEAGGRIDISDRTPNPRWSERPACLEPLPYIVVVIDELADLMMVCRSEVEESIARIAQKARAVGIHLILATQRPSVDIVTGVIKANLPARLSYRVNTKIDSRTILDSGGGEQLLGKGDALFLAPGTARPRRIHAPLITEKEIERLVEWLKERGAPAYNAALIKAMEADADGTGVDAGAPGASGDDIYERALAVVKMERKASTSLLQRKLSIGYSKAARLIDRMEDEGLIGPDRGAGKPREVYAEAGVGE